MPRNETVTLRKASCADLVCLRQMAQNYYEEISRFRANSPFQSAIADTWLSNLHTSVFFIEVGAEVAGFIVVIDNPYLPGVTGHYLAEFYVSPLWRDEIVAVKAGVLLMRRIPGEWTADVLGGNEKGRRFAAAMTRRLGRSVRTRRIETPWGNALRFRWFRGN